MGAVPFRLDAMKGTCMQDISLIKIIQHKETFLNKNLVRILNYCFSC